MPMTKGRSPLVVVDGVEYPSLERAAKALGIPPHILSLRLSSQDFPNYQRKWVSPDVEYDHLSGRPNPAQNTPVVIEGINYCSITAAAEQLGVKYEVVRYRLKSPRYPNYCRKDEIKLPQPAKARKPRKLPSNTVPVVVDGVEYPSMRQADLTLGFPCGTVSQRAFRA